MNSSPKSRGNAGICHSAEFFLEMKRTVINVPGEAGEVGNMHHKKCNGLMLKQTGCNPGVSAELRHKYQGGTKETAFLFLWFDGCGRLGKLFLYFSVYSHSSGDTTNLPKTEVVHSLRLLQWPQLDYWKDWRKGGILGYLIQSFRISQIWGFWLTIQDLARGKIKKTTVSRAVWDIGWNTYDRNCGLVLHQDNFPHQRDQPTAIPTIIWQKFHLCSTSCIKGKSLVW